MQCHHYYQQQCGYGQYVCYHRIVLCGLWLINLCRLGSHTQPAQPLKFPKLFPYAPFQLIG